MVSAGIPQSSPSSLMAALYAISPLDRKSQNPEVILLQPLSLRFNPAGRVSAIPGRGPVPAGRVWHDRPGYLEHPPAVPRRGVRLLLCAARRAVRIAGRGHGGWPGAVVGLCESAAGTSTWVGQSV